MKSLSRELRGSRLAAACRSLPAILVGACCGVTLAFSLPLLLTKSLWLDEAWVANDAVRPAVDPASLGTTPIGFVLLVAGIVRVAPQTDAAFRLAPLLFGLGAVPLTYLWARRLVHSPWAAGLAALLLATNLVFLVYCRTLKPYTADAFCAVLVFFLAERLRENPSPRRWAGYALVIAVAPLVSFGALFVIPVAAISLLPVSTRDRPKPARTWLIVHLAVAAALAVYAFAFVRHQRSGNLLAFWQGGFPPSSEPLAIVVWYGHMTLALTPYLFYPLNAWWAVPLQIAACLGLVACAQRRDWRVILLCCGPLALAAIAAVAHLYPYGGIAGGGRILLFTLPGLLVLAARGFTWLRDQIAGPRLVIGAAILLLAASVPIVDAGRYSVSLDHHSIPGDPSEETRQLIQDTLLVSLRRGDAVFVSYGAGDAFQFYAHQFRQSHRVRPPLFISRRDGVIIAFGAYPWDLCQVASLRPRRLWILAAHITAPTERALLIAGRTLGRFDLARHEPGADLFRLVPTKSHRLISRPPAASHRR